MRNIKIAAGEYYHIFNRGALKQNIFNQDSDYARFLFLILYLQSPVGFPQISRLVQYFVKHRVFDAPVEEVASKRYVELISFCLMPNHFHLIVRELTDNGIARYMQRILNGYTKYLNTKYEKSGHLFQGPYKAVHIESNDQLLYLSAYIHRNPRELGRYKNKEHIYPWSSHQDLVKENRWGQLLSSKIILEQFDSKKAYNEFVKTNTSKLSGDELLALNQ